jgi:hypothetical protein
MLLRPLAPRPAAPERTPASTSALRPGSGRSLRAAALGLLDAHVLHSLPDLVSGVRDALPGDSAFAAGAACGATGTALLLAARGLLPPSAPPLPPFPSPVTIGDPAVASPAGAGVPRLGEGGSDRVLSGAGVVLLQHLLTYFYPGLAEVLAAVIARRLQPGLERLKSATLRDVRVESLSLGAVPPRVAAVKLYDTPADTLVADVELEWACGGGLRLGVSLAEGGSLYLPVVADGIRFQGVIRIVMAPIMLAPPFLGAMIFSSVGRPNLDFRLSLLGGELSALPGLREALQEYASSLVDATFVWPKRILARPRSPPRARAPPPPRACPLTLCTRSRLLQLPFRRAKNPLTDMYFILGPDEQAALRARDFPSLTESRVASWGSRWLSRRYARRYAPRGRGRTLVSRALDVASGAARRLGLGGGARAKAAAAAVTISAAGAEGAAPLEAAAAVAPAPADAAALSSAMLLDMAGAAAAARRAERAASWSQAGEPQPSNSRPVPPPPMPPRRPWWRIWGGRR